MNISLADCFFGIGGNYVAFKKVFPFGEIPWGSELNHNKYGKYLTNLSLKNTPNKINLGNITLIKNPKQTTEIVGGFPCQDISGANPNVLLKRGIYGTSGSKSSLYSEQLRIAIESNIPIICFENVSEICINGLNVVLHDLYRMGYDVQYITYYLYEFGYPHGRSRTFIVAYKNNKTEQSIFNPDFNDFMLQYNLEIPNILFDENELTFTHENIVYPILVPRTTESSFRNQSLGNSVHTYAAIYQQDSVYRLMNSITVSIDKKQIGHIDNFYNDSNRSQYYKMPRCGMMIDGQLYETTSPNKKSFKETNNFSFSIPTPLKTISSNWEDNFCLARYNSKERHFIGKTSKFNIDPTVFFRKWYLLKNIKNINSMNIQDFNKIKSSLPDLIVNPILIEILMGFPINWTKI